MAQFSGIQHGKKHFFSKADQDDKQCAFMPTPKQIRDGCLEAQTNWSDQERERRCVYEVDPVELRQVPNNNTGQVGMYRRHSNAESGR